MLKGIKSFVIALLLLIGLEATSQKTTVWIVRHAEKDTSFANRLNPDLTVVGMQRAKDLAAYLQKENIVKIFSTDTKRTKQTATYFNMPIEIYNPKSLYSVLDFMHLDKK
jgi:broad specificity phosphatase PhoE